MTASFEILLWRASLATAPPVPSPAHLVEWADVLARAGEAAGAEALRDAAALPLGFGADVAAASSIEALLAELDALAGAVAPSLAPRLRARASDRRIEPIAAVAPAAAELRATLAVPSLDAAAAERLTGLLAALAGADALLPAFDYRAWRHAPLADLADAVATGSLIDFALSTRDLWSPPLGSAGLLHRAAHFAPAGLGAYFGMVGRTVRDHADLFDLARRAADKSGSSIDAWVALLSRGLPEPRLEAFVDTLGDGGASTVLRAILDRLLSHAAHVVDLDMARRLRDIGLDNADWRLAARAQAAVVRAQPLAYHERVILGSIEATGGGFGLAEATFRACLDLRPDDRDAAARLAAVRRHRFAGFEITRGYTTTPARQQARLRRRGVMPDYAGRRGERISAVDVS